MSILVRALALLRQKGALDGPTAIEAVGDRLEPILRDSGLHLEGDWSIIGAIVRGGSQRPCRSIHVRGRRESRTVVDQG